MQVSKQQELRSMGKLIFIGLFILVLGVSTIFRYQYLHDRPVHTDEAENAYILAADIQGDHYQFNPAHHHGPTLNYFLRIASSLHGFDNFKTMDMAIFRGWITAIGILTLALFYLLRSSISATALLASTILAGVSTLLVYYSNYVIHETLLGFFAIGLVATSIQFLQKPGRLKAIFIGLFLGLLLSTKITSLILLFSWAIAVATLYPANIAWIRTQSLKKLAGYTFIISLSAIAVCVTFYSSFFQHMQGISDALSSLFVYHTESGHEKPWHYFISNFFLPHFNQPFSIYEPSLLSLAFIGAANSIWNKIKANSLNCNCIGIFITVSIIVQILTYSAIAYKTPWLILVTWLHLALLAGIGFDFVCKQTKPLFRGVILIVFLVTIILQLKVTHRANVRFHSDVRNPMAYSPTSSNIEYLPEFLSKFPTTEHIGVYGEFMWPLPWYLRNLDTITYSSQSADYKTHNILILSDQSYPSFKSSIAQTYKVYPYTLRPDFPVYVCIHKTRLDETPPSP